MKDTDQWEMLSLNADECANYCKPTTDALLTCRYISCLPRAWISTHHHHHHHHYNDDDNNNNEGIVMMMLYTTRYKNNIGCSGKYQLLSFLLLTKIV